MLSCGVWTVHVCSTMPPHAFRMASGERLAARLHTIHSERLSRSAQYLHVILQCQLLCCCVTGRTQLDSRCDFSEEGGHSAHGLVREKLLVCLNVGSRLFHGFNRTTRCGMTNACVCVCAVCPAGLGWVLRWASAQAASMHVAPWGWRAC